MQNYEDLNIVGKNHFENIRAIGKFMVKKSFEKLYKKTDDDHWTNQLEQVVSVVNALYARWLNKVFIPAGILDGIFYDIDRPQYMNYGAIGAVIGHEMIHGFDRKGKHYDKSGQLYYKRVVMIFWIITNNAYDFIINQVRTMEIV